MDEAWTKVRIHFMYIKNAMNASLPHDPQDPQLYAHQPFLATDFIQDDPNNNPSQTGNVNQGQNVNRQTKCKKTLPEASS